MQRACVWLALCAVVHPAAPGTTAPAEPAPIRAREIADSLASEPTLSRSSLLEAVLERNPSVAAAEATWTAATEKIDQAASLEDPVASYALAPASVDASSAPFGEMLRLGQRLPFPGTLRLRREIAEAGAAAAERRVEEVRQRLAGTASRLYDDYWLTERALAIAGEHLELLESFKEVATSRYATGLAPLQAPLQAEVEAARLLHRQVVLRSQRRRLVARLNALLHRPVDASLPPAPERLDVDIGEASDGGESGEVVAVGAFGGSGDQRREAAVETGAAGRPEVAAQRAVVEELRASVALARAGKKPDFEVTAGYNSMWGTPEHRFTLGVGVRVPLWRQRIRAEVAGAEAHLAAGERTLVALEDSVAAEVESAFASLDEAEHAVRLYRSRVLPACRDQVTAARAAFASGEVSMLDLIDAERSLLTAELGHEEAVADLASARAELDLALGRMPFGLSASSTRRSDESRSDGESHAEGGRP